MADVAIQIFECPPVTPLNRLLSCHWGTRGRLKKKDAAVVALACQLHGITAAEGKRRVSVLAVYGKGQRATDSDATWKVLLDGLTACGVLRNDSHLWVELGTWEVARFADVRRSRLVVTLQDL